MGRRDKEVQNYWVMPHIFDSIAPKATPEQILEVSTVAMSLIRGWSQGREHSQRFMGTSERLDEIHEMALWVVERLFVIDDPSNVSEDMRTVAAHALSSMN